MLLLSPFAEKQRRATVEMALYHNRFVAALADHVFVTYAEPSSKTERFCHEVLSWGKRLYTFESEFNSALLGLGVGAFKTETLSTWQNE